MVVGVCCRLYAGVSKTLLNYVDWNAVGEKQGGVGVPEVVGANVFEAAALRYFLVGLREYVRAQDISIGSDPRLGVFGEGHVQCVEPGGAGIAVRAK